MIKILVTGGAGYIGSHSCKALALAGYTPVTYDNLERGHEWAVKWGPLEVGDIRDKERLAEVINVHQPEAVMHFAAYSYVEESVNHPEKYFSNNLEGTRSLLEAMHENNIDKIIFSSSCATYGIPNEIPITENHPQKPINPYGESKLKVEQLLNEFDRDKGIHSISLRYFNAAGADPEREIGEVHEPETHLIPLVLDAASGLKDGITVYGNDYDTRDGTCIRDYIHVTDLAEAHLLALDALQHEKKSSAYNLGNGNGYSVNEVISTTKNITGKDISVTIGQRRAGDPPVLVGSSDKIIDALNWQPKYKELEQIIETAWHWHKKFFKEKQ